MSVDKILPTLAKRYLEHNDAIAECLLNCTYRLCTDSMTEDKANKFHKHWNDWMSDCIKRANYNKWIEENFGNLFFDEL